ncbi:MAG: chlorite dismutase family protein [Chloroflexi bacterium]|nr:chlorite dismutase family protein [Chloroflexota bacterium]
MPPTKRRQTVKYNLYRIMPEWRRLPDAQRDAAKEQFTAVVEETASTMRIKSYSLVGMRSDADLMLWCVGRSLEEHQQFSELLNRTALASYLETPYSYLAMTRRSEYFDGHPQGDRARHTVKFGQAPYLVVYPFVKTRDWYTLPQEERQRMMDVHIQVGQKYPNVRINTNYSFGLDDYEFIVAFETDDPADFLDLVMELRGTEASKYTRLETPIFTGIARPVRECLDALG